MPTHREPAPKGVVITVGDKGVHSPEEQAASMPKPPIVKGGKMPPEVKKSLQGNMERYRKRVQDGLAALGKPVADIPQEKIDEIAEQARKELEAEGLPVAVGPAEQPEPSPAPAPVSARMTDSQGLSTEVVHCKNQAEADALVESLIRDDDSLVSATIRVKYSVVVVREL